MAKGIHTRKTMLVNATGEMDPWSIPEQTRNKRPAGCFVTMVHDRKTIRHRTGTPQFIQDRSPAVITQFFIRIQYQNPVAPGPFQRRIARRRKIITPLKGRHFSPVLLRNLKGPISRTRVHHNQLPRQTLHTLKTLRQKLLLVPRD
jgi:hypothetical protein